MPEIFSIYLMDLKTETLIRILINQGKLYAVCMYVYRN